MDGVLVFSVYGVRCLDEHHNILAEIKFGDTVDEAVSSLDRILQGEHDSTLEQFLAHLVEKEVDRVFVESRQLADELNQQYGAKTGFYEDIRWWREARSQALHSFATSESRKFQHDIAIQITRKAVQEASEQRDQLIIQAMDALDEAERTLNLFASRLREWYGLHFPEATKGIDNALSLAQLIVEGGQREQIQEKPELLQLLPKTAATSLESHQSMGARISQHDMVMIQALASQYLTFQRFREQLEAYLDEAMKTVAPNLRGLIGAIIGARLIGLAGSIERLAKLPASTIQVLGAERALFRALKTGTRPPKHGAIFQHTLVHSAPWWQRGKIARILAGKIAIAARIDLYSGQYVADELKETILTRIAEVKRKYPIAPKKPSTEKREKRVRRFTARRKRPIRDSPQAKKRKQPKGRKKRK